MSQVYGWHSHKVVGCDDTDFELYLFRTEAGKQSAKGRSKAIRDYCGKWCTVGHISVYAARTCPLFAHRKALLEAPVNLVPLAEKRDMYSVLDRETKESKKSSCLKKAHRTQQNAREHFLKKLCTNNVVRGMIT
jgi:hypothetical protein